MLVALLTLLFLGGGSTNAILEYVADSRPLIKEAVVDESRQKAALATLKEMKAQQKSYNKLVKGTVKELKSRLETDSGATGEEFWEEYFTAKQASDEEMLDLRFKLRDQLTREEWQVVFGTAANTG